MSILEKKYSGLQKERTDQMLRGGLHTLFASPFTDSFKAAKNLKEMGKNEESLVRSLRVSEHTRRAELLLIIHQFLEDYSNIPSEMLLEIKQTLILSGFNFAIFLQNQITPTQEDLSDAISILHGIYSFDNQIVRAAQNERRVPTPPASPESKPVDLKLLFSAESPKINFADAQSLFSNDSLEDPICALINIGKEYLRLYPKESKKVLNSHTHQPAARALLALQYLNKKTQYSGGMNEEIRSLLIDSQRKRRPSGSMPDVLMEIEPVTAGYRL